eukprot:s369_g6.t1
MDSHQSTLKNAIASSWTRPIHWNDYQRVWCLANRRLHLRCAAPTYASYQAHLRASFPRTDPRRIDLLTPDDAEKLLASVMACSLPPAPAVSAHRDDHQSDPDSHLEASLLHLLHKPLAWNDWQRCFANCASASLSLFCFLLSLLPRTIVHLHSCFPAHRGQRQLQYQPRASDKRLFHTILGQRFGAKCVDVPPASSYPRKLPHPSRKVRRRPLRALRCNLDGLASTLTEIAADKAVDSPSCQRALRQLHQLRHRIAVLTLQSKRKMSSSQLRNLRPFQTGKRCVS